MFDYWIICCLSFLSTLLFSRAQNEQQSRLSLESSIASTGAMSHMTHCECLKTTGCVCLKFWLTAFICFIKGFKMNVSQTLETEEDLLTCLHIKFYHPQQNCRPVYGLIPVRQKSKHSADDPLRLGRDGQACTYALVDPRVSRKQLAIHAYRTPQSPDLLFTIQNLSQRGRLSVNSSSLDYLERMDLPDKALIRFGEYEMLIIRESGEAKGSFEVHFDVLEVPPSRETCLYVSSMTPVVDTGSCVTNGLPAELTGLGPLETDETLMYPSSEPSPL